MLVAVRRFDNLDSAYAARSEDAHQHPFSRFKQNI